RREISALCLSDRLDGAAPDLLCAKGDRRPHRLVRPRLSHRFGLRLHAEGNDPARRTRSLHSRDTGRLPGRRHQQPRLAGGDANQSRMLALAARPSARTAARPGLRAAPIATSAAAPTPDRADDILARVKVLAVFTLKSRNGDPRARSRETWNHQQAGAFRTFGCVTSL